VVDVQVGKNAVSKGDFVSSRSVKAAVFPKKEDVHAVAAQLQPNWDLSIFTTAQEDLQKNKAECNYSDYYSKLNWTSKFPILIDNITTKV
jgi:hypothetical protein